MRVVVASSERLSGNAVRALIGAGHQVVAVISPRKGIYQSQAAGYRFWGMKLRGWDLLKTCKKFNVPFRVSKNLSEGANLSFLRNAKADLLVVLGWPNLVEDKVLNMFRCGGMNIHPSLLPKLRGADPLFPLIDRGLDGFGVTFHRMVQELDAGPIYHSVPLVKKSINTYDGLYRKVMYAIWRNLPKAIEALESNPEGRPQQGEPSMAPKFRKSYRYLDIHKDGRASAQRSLACFSHHSLIAATEEVLFHFRRCRFSAKAHQEKPGTILSISPWHIKVATERGALSLLGYFKPGRPIWLSRYQLWRTLKKGQQILPKKEARKK